MTNIRQRIEELIHYLQQGIYEKNTETALALLAALAGESILLLGPPGVAKSMVARRLKEAFKGAASFEYLMSRFSTPDEIFGPISIARLKESDKYERAITGYLPTADVVFLDEIWKAGPAIQNTLLTVMNEKLFRNGDKELHLPLKLLIAASNELPAKGEGLEALWDRFVIRIVCRCIQDETTFRHMLCADDEAEKNASSAVVHPITNREYATWQKEAQKVVLSQDLLEAITYIRQHLQRVEVEGTELPRSIYISDRRWKHIARLLRISADVQ
uniref:AAA family ATPase n=1 Tax=Alloprevotella sp. TaxID=1872471 RepID=UPI003FF063D3